ncbi:MAG: hypothetical protein ACWA44_02445 [Thiotrichales bacterium]
MLKENIDKKVTLLDKAVDVFYAKILQVERRIMRLLGPYLDRFESEDGKLRNISANRRRLLSLDNAILKILGKANLSDEVARFLKNFDEIERLNRLIYEEYLPPSDIDKLVRLNFDLQKLDIIEAVTIGLTDPTVVRANIIKPIRSLIIQSVARERSVKELNELLRDEIISRQGSNSTLLRYTRQISQDAISQYDGALNDGIRDELGLDGFFYLGTVIKTTRQNCFDLVRGTGKYADLAIRPGAYRVADIPEIIARAPRCTVHHSSARRDCGSGFNPVVTPETFGQYRMGWGCRHPITYFRLLENDVPRGLRNIT